MDLLRKIAAFQAAFLKNMNFHEFSENSRIMYITNTLAVPKKQLKYLL